MQRLMMEIRLVRMAKEKGYKEIADLLRARGAEE